MAQATVLVVGSGGREHALAARLRDSPQVGRVVVCPGNAGVVRAGLEASNGDPLQVARDLPADLVVVGPEIPLCQGLVDRLTTAGILAYGPNQAASQLEASKAFMKRFAVQHGIRTARHVTVTALEQLDDALSQFSAPPVVKAVGLCAGKGVVVAESFEVAHQTAREMLSGVAFGEAGKQLVLEERLFGQELSIHAVCDGKRALLLPAIQDHKRIGEGDTGPNTGGMGTYGPAVIATEPVLTRVKEEVVDRIVLGMHADGVPFQGTLFTNLMLTPEGQHALIEINVRFGDPETQVLMNLLDGDLYELLASAARGNVNADAVSLTDRHGMCVVLAAANYPAPPRKGDQIYGLAEAESVPGVHVYHAGTTNRGDAVFTSGGRVLGVTAVGSDLAEAKQRAYAACDRISFEGMQYRRDIGHQALPK